MLQTIQQKFKKNKVPNKEITCLAWKAATVNRNITSKWYVSRKEFADSKYPLYCSGFFLLISGSSISSMYKHSLDEKFFWIDDIWLTGIVARKAGVKIIGRKKSIYQNVDVEKKFMKSEKASLESLGGHLDKNVNKLVNIWNHLLKIYINKPKLIKVHVNKYGWSDFNFELKEFVYFKN